jgi:hypothetical protein
VRLDPGNAYAWGIICEISPLLFSAGGVNGQVIAWALDEFDVPSWQRHEIRRKITAYAATVMEEARGAGR